jgi:hypothetical protein
MPTLFRLKTELETATQPSCLSSWNMVANTNSAAAVEAFTEKLLAFHHQAGRQFTVRIKSLRKKTVSPML